MEFPPAIRKVAVLCALLGTTALPVLTQPPDARPRPSGPWMNTSLSADDRAALLVRELTLDEKLSLVKGLGWGPLLGGEQPAGYNGGAGFIPGIPRVGIPDLQMADAAVGVTRGAVFGRYSTPLPSAIAEAATWDSEAARQYGALIGSELRAQGYNMSLGGGVNLTREARNGRNFEYKGEDPILAGTLLAAEMKALSARGIIAHTKHYALNDQENGRGFVDIKLDKRSMRESDLLAFEIGLKDSGIGAVMCSYNLLNGVYACENSYLLTDLLKKEWGFKGFVVSDWSGTHSTAKAVLAGLDMEMPEDKYLGKPLKDAIASGEVPMARLDDMVKRILRSEFLAGLFERPATRQVPDVAAGLEVAQRVAEQSIVLLKNSGQLPLTPAVHSIAVIGSHADVGVVSGGGSAQVDAPGGNAVPPAEERKSVFGAVVWHPSSPLKAIRARVPNAKVEYNDGADKSEAARLARSSDVAIVFVNQPSSEGADLPSLALPDKQDELVEAVVAANPRTIVVVESSGAITMPWADRVSAILEAWYPGIRGGEAIAGILFGDVNPSGRLPITFPKSEADLPHPQLAQQPDSPADMVEVFPGYKQNTRKFSIEFTEGLKVGYKWYEAEGKQPLFPFGHGLSYTTFTYSDLEVARKTLPGNVSVKVKNTGRREGSDVVQFYATLPGEAGEPFKRLIGWAKIALKPGESREVRVSIDAKYLSIFNAEKDAWELLPGYYTVYAGSSSRNLPLKTTVGIAASKTQTDGEL